MIHRQKRMCCWTIKIFAHTEQKHNYKNFERIFTLGLLKQAHCKLDTRQRIPCMCYVSSNELLNPQFVIFMTFLIALL